MSISLKAPDMDNKDLQKFLDHLILAINREDATFMKSASANNNVLLLDPNQKVYSVTVNAAGALVATKVQG